MYRLAAFADEADRTLRGQISAMKDNGIELLEIRTVDGKNIAELTAAEAKTIRKELDGAGIAVWSVGSPMGKIISRWKAAFASSPFVSSAHTSLASRNAAQAFGQPA